MNCKICKTEFEYSSPHYENVNLRLCWDCAFKSGFLSEKKYLENCGVSDHLYRACAYNGDIFIWYGRKNFEISRRNPIYNYLKKSVFERDNNQCIICGDTKEIEIHHIKSKKNNPELFYKLENVITLCKDCHIKQHQWR